ncbi:YgaP family membrane protein [Jannaschia pohangensis]|uniref:Inner membrane protein YgaP-like transmembrane domain-containing protein n=1 Tax=Jannaschia pohangensis TaxID=390807 RepID=A0A1I3H0A7_9RHOB|nr:DUF2892 domain-containing protein [Jannaschia pohangensis]SFI29119.1 Protein of unknown function [Jannaschia pohangensis]
MTRNVGSADMIIRLGLGLALIVAPLLNVPPVWASPVLGYGAMIVGTVLVLTSLFRFCPLYRVLGLNTCGI